jgi:hypothetical protein
MTTLTDPYRELLVEIEPLGPDELRVLTALAHRLALGQRQYGRLDLLRDARDYLRERHEEILDAAIYESSHAVRARLLGNADTDPCPPPMPTVVTLENGTKVLDWPLPDDRDTERGS